MRFLILSLFLLVGSASLAAQTKTLKQIQSDIDDIKAANAAAIQTMSPNRGLIEPRKLNTMKGDLEKLYFDVTPTDGRLHMVNGKILGAKLRYRLFDQLVEATYGDESYALDLGMVKAFTIGDANFVLFPDPMREKMGRVIHQVHYVDDDVLVLEQHWTEEDHREKLNNVPSTDSQYLRRSSDVILVVNDEPTSVTSQKVAMKALGIRSKKTKAGRYVEANRLKLRKAEDLAQLVTYLTSNDLIK